MALKKLWNQFVKKYMKNTAESIDGMEFPTDEVRRYRIKFSGLVQGVGFRYETWSIAQKLNLVGFVENLPNGMVYAEIEGEKNKILYLIDSLKSIPRIQIQNIEINEMELKKESTFEIGN